MRRDMSLLGGSKRLTAHCYWSRIASAGADTSEAEPLRDPSVPNAASFARHGHGEQAMADRRDRSGLTAIVHAPDFAVVTSGRAANSRVRESSISPTIDAW